MSSLPYWIILWTIVIAFLALTVITILGLLQKINISPTYMKGLFTNLILGFVTAGFYIFYQQNQVDITPDEKGLVVLNRQGEPQDFRIEQGDKVLLHLDPDSIASMSDIRRSGESNGDRILIKTNSGFPLGWIRSENNQTQPLSVTQQLDLGIYYSSNSTNEAGYGQQALQYLTDVLKSENASDPQRVKATSALYRVLSFMTEPAQFKLLISNLHQLMTYPDHFYEIAESYRVFYDKTGTNKIEKFTGVLKNYIKFLIDSEFIRTTNDPAQIQRREQIQQNMRFYLDRLVNNIPYISANKTRIESDIASLNVAGLRDHYDQLPEPDLTQID